MLSCQQCRDELPEFALGDSEDSLRVAVEEHLKVCGPCRHELEATRDGWARFSATAESIAPQDRLWDRIALRTAAPTAAPAANWRQGAAFSPVSVGGESITKAILSRGQKRASWAVAAAVVVGLGAALLKFANPGPSHRDHAELVRRLATVREFESLAKLQGVEFSLIGRQPSGPVRALAAFDPGARQWHLFVVDLPGAPAGKVYQTWILAAGDKAELLRPGPTIAPNRDNVAAVLLDYHSVGEGGKSIAISLEPAAGATAPTGDLILTMPLQ